MRVAEGGLGVRVLRVREAVGDAETVAEETETEAVSVQVSETLQDFVGVGLALGVRVRERVAVEGDCVRVAAREADGVAEAVRSRDLVCERLADRLSVGSVQLRVASRDAVAVAEMLALAVGEADWETVLAPLPLCVTVSVGGGEGVSVGEGVGEPVPVGVRDCCTVALAVGVMLGDGDVVEVQYGDREWVTVCVSGTEPVLLGLRVSETEPVRRREREAEGVAEALAVREPLQVSVRS